MAAGDNSLVALYPAAGAVLVAAIGLIGNVVLYQKRRRDPEDMAGIQALAQALVAETARANLAERRCAECEARERARESDG